MAYEHQTAANVASRIVAGGLAGGVIEDIEGAQDAFATVMETALTAIMAEAPDEEEAEEKPRKRSASKSKSKGKSRGKGKSKGKGKGGGKLTLDKALKKELTFGKFKGETLGDVAELSASEAEEDFGYETGPGSKYIEWLADQDPDDMPALQPAAQLILDAIRSGDLDVPEDDDDE